MVLPFIEWKVVFFVLKIDPHNDYYVVSCSSVFSKMLNCKCLPVFGQSCRANKERLSILLLGHVAEAGEHKRGFLHAKKRQKSGLENNFIHSIKDRFMLDHKVYLQLHLGLSSIAQSSTNYVSSIAMVMDLLVFYIPRPPCWPLG